MWGKAMKTLLEVITAMLVESGLDPKMETTEMLAGSLHNLFEHEWSRIEIQTAISELEKAIGQKNKMLYGDKVQEDIAGRGLIDPRVLQLRVQGLRKMLK